MWGESQSQQEKRAPPPTSPPCLRPPNDLRARSPSLPIAICTSPISRCSARLLLRVPPRVSSRQFNQLRPDDNFQIPKAARVKAAISVAKTAAPVLFPAPFSPRRPPSSAPPQAPPPSIRLSPQAPARPLAPRGICPSPPHQSSLESHPRTSPRHLSLHFSQLLVPQLPAAGLQPDPGPASPWSLSSRAIDAWGPWLWCEDSPWAHIPSRGVICVQLGRAELQGVPGLSRGG